MLIKNKLGRVVSVPRELGIHLIGTDGAELYIEEEKPKKVEVKVETKLEEVKLEEVKLEEVKIIDKK